MGRLEPIDGKMTKWEGLWWHPEQMQYTSACINLADIRKFKGNVRLVVRKNRYYNGGENGRPNYCFSLRDAKSESAVLMQVEDEPRHCRYDDDSECYYDEDDNRLYTGAEVRAIINGTVDDVKYGITDPYDILPSDFV